MSCVFYSWDKTTFKLLDNTRNFWVENNLDFQLCSRQIWLSIDMCIVSVMQGLCTLTLTTVHIDAISKKSLATNSTSVNLKGDWSNWKSEDFLPPSSFPLYIYNLFIKVNTSLSFSLGAFLNLPGSKGVWPLWFCIWRLSGLNGVLTLSTGPSAQIYISCWWFPTWHWELVSSPPCYVASPLHYWLLC